MSNTILVYFLKMYGNKKGMGVSTFEKAWEYLLSPIPTIRPSHCPMSRISNAASPRQAEL